MNNAQAMKDLGQGHQDARKGLEPQQENNPHYMRGYYANGERVARKEYNKPLLSTPLTK